MAFEGLHDDRVSVGALASRIRASAASRAALLAVTDAYRLIDGAGDQFDGIVVERYGDFAVVNVFDSALYAFGEQCAAALSELGARGVYLKQRVRADLRHADLARLTPNAVASGVSAPETHSVREHTLALGVSLADGFSSGLFLDQRDNRHWFTQQALGKQVLNLFAYTGSFSVAAGVGGALRVTSVDLSQRALRRADANLRLNSLPPAQHRLLRADAVDWLRRAVARGEGYDLIVLDPPSFSSVGSDTFSVARQYRELVAQCLRLLLPAGTLLAVTNHQATSVAQFREQLTLAALDAGRKIQQLELPEPPLDCSNAKRAPDLSTKCARIWL